MTNPDSEPASEIVVYHLSFFMPDRLLPCAGNRKICGDCRVHSSIDRAVALAVSDPVWLDRSPARRHLRGKGQFQILFPAGDLHPYQRRDHDTELDFPTLESRAGARSVRTRKPRRAGNASAIFGFEPRSANRYGWRVFCKLANDTLSVRLRPAQANPAYLSAIAGRAPRA
jgi:hypothetical protein